jgi:hypothetical protein
MRGWAKSLCRFCSGKGNAMPVRGRGISNATIIMRGEGEIMRRKQNATQWRGYFKCEGRACEFCSDEGNAMQERGISNARGGRILQQEGKHDARERYFKCEGRAKLIMICGCYSGETRCKGNARTPRGGYVDPATTREANARPMQGESTISNVRNQFCGILSTYPALRQRET